MGRASLHTVETRLNKTVCLDEAAARHSGLSLCQIPCKQSQALHRGFKPNLAATFLFTGIVSKPTVDLLGGFLYAKLLVGILPEDACLCPEFQRAHASFIIRGIN